MRRGKQKAKPKVVGTEVKRLPDGTVVHVTYVRSNNSRKRGRK